MNITYNTFSDLKTNMDILLTDISNVSSIQNQIVDLVDCYRQWNHINLIKNECNVSPLHGYALSRVHESGIDSILVKIRSISLDNLGSSLISAINTCQNSNVLFTRYNFIVGLNYTYDFKNILANSYHNSAGFSNNMQTNAYHANNRNEIFDKLYNNMTNINYSIFDTIPITIWNQMRTELNSLANISKYTNNYIAHKAVHASLLKFKKKNITVTNDSLQKNIHTLCKIFNILRMIFSFTSGPLIPVVPVTLSNELDRLAHKMHHKEILKKQKEFDKKLESYTSDIMFL